MCFAVKNSVVRTIDQNTATDVKDVHDRRVISSLLPFTWS